MKYLDPTWRYHTAQSTAKPGYLQRRFAQIRKAQAEEKRREEQEELARIAKVRPMTRSA